MSGIFPDITNGAIVTSLGGVPTGATGVSNAYLPTAPFTVSCPVTAYSNAPCSFSVLGANMNAVNAELALLAEAFNPPGVWNCGTIGNVAANYVAWKTGTGPTSLTGLVNAASASAIAATVPSMITTALNAFVVNGGTP